MRIVFNCLLILIALLAREGLGAAQVDPPSGSVVANFEGTLNATTLTCNITAPQTGSQVITSWSVRNFRGVTEQGFVRALAPELFSIGGDPIPATPSITYDNQMTILNLTSELDRVVLSCVFQQEELANFTLRVYRPPNLRDNFVVRIEESSRNVPVDIGLEPEPFPLDTVSFSWTRDDQPLSGGSGLVLTYSTVTFSTIRRSDSGVYSVAASNHITGDPSQQIGNDTGSFSLDVLYGPTFMELGPTQRYVLLGDPLSLVCGRDLDSNPQADVAWTAPDGTTIMDNDRYDLENGPDIVRLNFTHTILSDDGVWMCNIQVESELYVVSSGSLIRVDSAIIGVPIQQNIQLTVIVTPNEPRNFAVDTVGATYMRVCWEAPFNSSVSYYLINASSLNDTGGIIVANTSSNATFYNVTGLLPGTTYELTVVAVSQGGNVVARGQASEPMVRTTGSTVPSLVCNDPAFDMGGITARWSYIHTGGQELMSVLISYTFEEGGRDSAPISVMNTDSTIESINVPRLIAGTRYTFNITAENEIGSSYVLCEPVLLNAGIPLTPVLGELFAGDTATQIRLQIKTQASGEGSGFKFNIVPVRNGMEETRQGFMNDTYVSGTFVTLTVGDLTEGGTYTFSATAENNYGESGIANSPSIVIGELPPPSAGPPPSQEPEADSSVGAAVGGAIGGIAVVALIVLIVIVIILLFIRRGRVYRPNKAEGDHVKYQPAPTSESTTQVQEVSVDIGEPMHKDAEIQYAELDTFRPPSQQKNGGAAKEPKPMEPEEPVEYAVITNFKKKEDDPAPVIIETSAVPDPTPDTTTGEGDADKTGTSTTLV